MDTTRYDPAKDEEDPDVLLKVLCGAVNRRVDNLARSPDERSPGSAVDSMTSVSTPVFHLLETPAQLDGSYKASAPAQVPSSTSTILGDTHDCATDVDDDDEAGLGIAHSPSGDEENLRPIRRKADPRKGFEAWISPPTYTWTYSNPYPKAAAVVLLACVVLYFVGLYYRPTTYLPAPTPPE